MWTPVQPPSTGLFFSFFLLLPKPPSQSPSQEFFSLLLPAQSTTPTLAGPGGAWRARNIWPMEQRTATQHAHTFLDNLLTITCFSLSFNLLGITQLIVVRYLALVDSPREKYQPIMLDRERERDRDCFTRGHKEHAKMLWRFEETRQFQLVITAEKTRVGAQSRS